MRIAVLAMRNSIHTVRWVNALSARGHEVHLLSSTSAGEPLLPAIKFHPLLIPPPWGYIGNAIQVQRLLSNIQPDILNTHFASGYGTLGRLSGFHPNVLSVWGSDVYDFPVKSPIHRVTVELNLQRADWITSTSNVMARQTRSLYPHANIDVVPFGIDTSKFYPSRDQGRGRQLTIGTVKTLSRKYGIDLLIKSFAVLRQNLEVQKNQFPEVQVRLLIVGTGPDEEKLKQLAHQLGVYDSTTFVGSVPHSEVPHYLRKLDVYVALSRMESESFGVAILEASASGLPVLVSDVGGLPEVVMDGLTGHVVPSEDYKMAALRLEELILNPQLRLNMGQSGRVHVKRHYGWNMSVDQMETVFKKVVRPQPT